MIMVAKQKMPYDNVKFVSCLPKQIILLEKADIYG